MVSEIISALLSGLQQIPQAIGKALNSTFNSFFLTEEGGSISVFAQVMLVFGGIALALGLGKLVLNLIRNKVGR